MSCGQWGHSKGSGGHFCPSPSSTLPSHPVVYPKDLSPSPSWGSRRTWGSRGPSQPRAPGWRHPQGCPRLEDPTGFVWRKENRPLSPPWRNGACPRMIPSAGTSGFHQPSEFLTRRIPGLALNLKVSKLEKVKTKQEELKNGNLHRFLPGWHCRIKGCSSPGWDSRWEHPSREAGRAQPPPRLPWLSSSHPKTSKQHNSPFPAPLVGIPGV